MVQRVNSIETSHELPVESLLNQSIEGFMDIHKQLMKLPQDPKDPLLPAEAMLRDLGVDVDNDFSMFIMGMAGKFGLDTGMSAMGLPTEGLASTSLDVASSILMGYSDDRRDKQQARNTPTRTKGATAMYNSTSKFKRAPESKNAPKKQQAPSTAMLRMAMKRRQAILLKNTEKQRMSLRRDLKTHMENIRDLIVFKSCGVKYAHRITVPVGDTGEFETYLVAAKDKPFMALKSDGRSYEKPVDLSMMQKQQAAPKMAMGF